MACKPLKDWHTRSVISFCLHSSFSLVWEKIMLCYIHYLYQEGWTLVSESVIEKMPCYFCLFSLPIAIQNCASSLIHWVGTVWDYHGLLMGTIASWKVGYSNAYKKTKRKIKFLYSQGIIGGSFRQNLGEWPLDGTKRSALNALLMAY